MAAVLAFTPFLFTAPRHVTEVCPRFKLFRAVHPHRLRLQLWFDRFDALLLARNRPDAGGAGRWTDE